MRAIILAGGRGARLGGLTDFRSKVLLPVAGKPLLDWLLDELALAGVSEVVIVHYYAGERILTHIGSGRDFDLDIRFALQQSDRGTMGSLMTGFSQIGEDERMLVLNGDNMVRADAIKSLMKVDGNGLLISEHDTPQLYGVVELSGSRIRSIDEKPDPDSLTSRVVSTGVWLLSSEVIRRLQSDFEAGQTELSTAINSGIEQGLEIEAVRTDEWHDLDHPWDMLKLNRRLLESIPASIAENASIADTASIEGDVHIGEGTVIHPGCVLQGPLHIGENCDIGPLAILTGSTSIGSGCRIGPLARIRSSIVMRDVQIDSNCAIHHSVIGPATTLKSHVQVDAGPVEKHVRNTHYRIRRLGLVTGESCMLEHGVVCSPGTILGSQVWIGRRTRVHGEHDAGVRLMGGNL